MLLDRIIIGLFAAALVLLPPMAEAQSVIQAFPPGTFQNRAAIDASASAPAFSCTYEAFATENSGTNTGTFNSVAIGPANTNRVVAVIAGARNSTSTAVSSVTIGGISATHVASANSPTGPTMASDIWYAQVPTGTTANIVVVWNGTTVVSGIQVYSIITSTPVPTAGNAAGNASFTSISTTITVPSGGCAIVGSALNGTPITLSNVVTDASSDFSGGTRAFSAGHTTTAGTQTPIATNGVNAATVISAAAWSP